MVELQGDFHNSKFLPLRTVSLFVKRHPVLRRLTVLLVSAILSHLTFAWGFGDRALYVTSVTSSTTQF